MATHGTPDRNSGPRMKRNTAYEGTHQAVVDRGGFRGCLLRAVEPSGDSSIRAGSFYNASGTVNSKCNRIISGNCELKGLMTGTI